MKKTLMCICTFALIILFGFSSTNSIYAQTSALSGLETELDKALEDLNDEIERIRKLDPKAHEDFKELKELRQKVKDLSDKIQKEVEEEHEKRSKKIERTGDKEKKAELEKEYERDSLIMEKLKEWAKKAKDLADAKGATSTDPVAKKAYDEKKKAVDDAKKAHDTAVKDKEIKTALEKAKADLDKEKDRNKPDKKKVKDLEKKIKDLEKELETLGESEKEETPKENENNSIMPPKKYFLVGLGISKPLTAPDERRIELTDIQTIVYNPASIEALVTVLRGEYVLGTPFVQAASSYPLIGRTTFAPKLFLGLGFGGKYEILSSVQYSRQNWTGKVPMTLYPFGNIKPQALQGEININTQSFGLSTEARCLWGKGLIRPFTNLGFRVNLHQRESGMLHIAGVEFDLPSIPTQYDFAPFVGVGARIRLIQKIQLELAGTFGKLPNMGYAPAINMSVLARF